MNTGGGFKCRECKAPTTSVLRITLPQTIIGGRPGGGQICVNCFERLNKEGAPASLRLFQKWYSDNKLKKDPYRMIAEQRRRIEELESLVKSLNDGRMA